MDIKFKRLTEVSKSAIVELMSSSLVRRQMPLLTGDFTDEDCDKFIASKEQMWEQHGFGPYAFEIDGKFAGWGGVQPDDGEADLALVLHPDFWGVGKVLYKKIIDHAFGEMNLDSVVVFFPPSRTRIQGFLRLGFVKDTEMEVGDEKFIRYRLMNPSKGS